MCVKGFTPTTRKLGVNDCGQKTPASTTDLHVLVEDLPGFGEGSVFTLLGDHPLDGLLNHPGFYANRLVLEEHGLHEALGHKRRQPGRNKK